MTGTPLVSASEGQHVYHHYDNDGARVNVSFERNSRGVNTSATVVNAKSVDEAIAMLLDADKKLKLAFPPITSETEVKEKKKASE